MTELELQAQVADYLRLQYSHVLFHSDFGSGIKLTPGQAMRQKRLQGGRRSWPDMFIAEPMARKIDLSKDSPFDKAAKLVMHAGLFIELKKAGTRIYRKDGRLVSDAHIREQYDMLEQLRQRGYVAEFACGFDEAKKIIDEYLGGLEAEEVEF